jgi:hypothetical protein
VLVLRRLLVLVVVLVVLVLVLVLVLAWLVLMPVLLVLVLLPVLLLLLLPWWMATVRPATMGATIAGVPFRGAGPTKTARPSMESGHIWSWDTSRAARKHFGEAFLQLLPDAFPVHHAHQGFHLGLDPLADLLCFLVGAVVQDCLQRERCKVDPKD